jgi:hypothetical protein
VRPTHVLSLSRESVLYTVWYTFENGKFSSCLLAHRNEHDLQVITATTMSNEVWVRWTFPQSETLFGRVKRLGDGAVVVDLRDAFVDQQNLTTTVPGELKVSTADGTVLSEDAIVKPFFVTPGTQETAPGKSKNKALLVTFPPQQQQNGELRCCSSCIQFVIVGVI